MLTNEKATRQSGSNQFDYLTGNQNGLSTFDIATTEEKLQSNLLASISQNPKVVRLYHCFGCQKSFGVKKMSNCLVICKGCFALAQEKGERAQRNFIDRTLNNVHGFLRRRVMLSRA